MGMAISALIAALAVVYSLSVTATNTSPVSTMLRVLLDLASGHGRVLTAEEALTSLFYAIVVYVLVFSISFFILRFFGIFMTALGVPDDQTLRANREMRRNDRVQLNLQRRQAKLNAEYMVRVQGLAQSQGRSFAAAGPSQSIDDDISGLLDDSL